MTTSQTPAWRLVPVDRPTLEMGWAYLEAAREGSPGTDHAFSHPGYRAMVLASPSPDLPAERARLRGEVLEIASSYAEDLARENFKTAGDTFDKLRATVDALAALPAPTPASVQPAYLFAKDWLNARKRVGDAFEQDSEHLGLDDVADMLRDFAAGRAALGVIDPTPAERAQRDDFLVEALEFLYTSILTRADVDYQERAMARAEKALRTAMPGWSPPFDRVPTGELQPGAAPQAVAAEEPTLAFQLAEHILHMEMVTARGKRARELARRVLAAESEALRFLRLIAHATSPTPDDGGHHESAYELAQQGIATLMANGPAETREPATQCPHGARSAAMCSVCSKLASASVATADLLSIDEVADETTVTAGTANSTICGTSAAASVAGLAGASDDETARWAEAHGAQVAWANDADMHHLIKFTPPELRSALAKAASTRAGE